MAESNFEVIFQGQLLPGADGVAVRAKLAALFKIDAARIEAMFAGQRVVIKKNVDAATAQTYVAALDNAGAIAEIISMAAPAVAAPSEPRQEVPVAPIVMTIAAPGVLLVEPEPVTPPTFDTSALSLAAVGVDLVEPSVKIAPQYDLSGLQLAPPGTLLADAPPVPPAKIDTSGLALSER